ncbi:sulfurtransferase-like selenium metabolism protein YedF [Chloroflexota bacterium]
MPGQASGREVGCRANRAGLATTCWSAGRGASCKKGIRRIKETNLLTEVNMVSKVFLVTSDVMGRGEDELGKLLMANFLRLLGEGTDKPVTMIFLNSGVRLVCRDSNVLNHVRKLEAQGVEILVCTTCLEYLDLTDKLEVGKPTTMAKTIQSMLSANVVSL